jgi:hypothetical protein
MHKKVALICCRQLFAGVVICCCNACGHHHRRDCSSVDFTEGDIVFRRGDGNKSSVVLRVDSMGIYSHCGIVVKQDSAFMIVHVAPGERSAGETEDRIKMESPNAFFDESKAIQGGVFRLQDISRSVAAQAARQAKRLFEKGILFDHDYSLEDSTAMYCTELVWYSYLLAGKDITGGKRSEIANFPLYSGSYIFPSDIYHNNPISLIYKF